MKIINFIMKQICFLFLTIIMVFGNIILNLNIVSGAEKKNIKTDYKEELGQYISNKNNIINESSDNDKLFEKYLNKLFYGNNKKSNNFEMVNLSTLNDNEKILYIKLKNIITEIADGKRDVTKFTIDNLNFHSTYETSNKLTKDEVLRKFFKDELNIHKIINLLLFDCPYELYWYNKSKGVTWGDYGYTYNSESHHYHNYVSEEESDSFKSSFTLKNITFKFHVASDYAQNAGNNQYYIYSVDALKVKRAQESKKNADSIIQKYMDLDDYNKLYNYMYEICKLVQYDDKVVGKGDLLTINDPYQLISVFDNDNTTNVVCEGYSKAFAYLCENSNFQNDIKCYIVTGIMETTTEGGHSWNIVTMENGKNYMVDITNCDGNGIGSPEQLFLAGLSGDIDSGYIFTNRNGYKAYYKYDEDTKQIYSRSILEMSDTNYHLETEPETPNDGSDSSIGIGEKIIYKNANYNVISVNGIVSLQFSSLQKKTKEVVIPATIKIDGKIYNVTDIADSAMKNNKKVKKLTIGKNIEHIGKSAFQNCKNLKKIIFKTKKLTIKKIGKNAFKGINSNVVIVESE